MKQKLINTMKEIASKRGINNIIGINDTYLAMKNLNETEYYNTFVVSADSLGFKFGSDSDPRLERLVMSFFAMSATLLSKLKKTDTNEATALILQDVNGNFKYAGIVEYHENEENPEEPGNWSYVTTFDEKDIIDLEKKKKVNKNLYGGTQFTTVFNHVSYDIGSIEWTQESFMYDGCILVIDSLLQVLDSEAKPGEVVDIEFPGYFKASVSVEGDEKVFAISPDGHMKAIIKEDIAIER